MANSQLSVNVTLLWENPSPSAPFAAQKLPLDLTKYTFVFIEAVAATAWLKVGGTNAHMYSNIITSLRVRACSAETDGVTFTAGYNNATQDNSEVIPLRIYGINI